jgi:hypothetical protein
MGARMDTANGDLVKEFDLSEVQYGTLLTSEVMQHLKANQNHMGQYGLIAHPLIPTDKDISIRFRIDTGNRKLAIVLTDSSLVHNVTRNLSFEWNFRE